MNSPWQFWIDVGGTFTDCYARKPDGSLQREKVLSSGVTKLAVGEGSNSRRICLSGSAFAADFWNDYEVRLLDELGQTAAESAVRAYDPVSHSIDLKTDLPVTPNRSHTVELFSHEPAPLLAIRRVLELPLDAKIDNAIVRLGTTRGTNALLTRRGARTGLVTTRGFGDILDIGNQARPKLFAVSIQKPPVLYSSVMEIDERILSDGSISHPLDEAAARQALQSLRDAGIESLAICLLNAYVNAEHEQCLQQLAQELGFDEISCSHEVAPLIKLVSRGDTTVVDAYLNPVLRRYVGRLRGALGNCELKLLTSAGGLASAEVFTGKDSILSGPAGGVVGFSRVSEAAGFDRAIGFDMGGTSTDVSRFDGRFDLEYETEKAGVRIVAPMMAIETVAAGGGSICSFDGIKLGVGPDSAGADPGPMCYGRGGPLTVTDINYFLGKIPADHFPFPLISRKTIESRIQELAERVNREAGILYSPVELADGFLQIANANMARAIRSVSIAKGYDPADYVLVAFGGAAAQHACAIADDLGMQRILNHPDAGILSAYGIGMADVVRHRMQGIYRPYTADTRTDIEPVFQQLSDAAADEVAAEGIPRERIEVTRSLDLRYQGLDAYLTVPWDNPDYEGEFRKLYGYTHQDRPLELVALRVAAVGRSDTRPPVSRRVAVQEVESRSVTRVHFRATAYDTAVFDRQDLPPGARVVGPAIVLEPHATTVVDPGWEAAVLSRGELLLTRSAPSADRTAAATTTSAPDPIQLELFNNQFAAIAEQMGITLRNTASSVNVKERLDYSCALFTATGDLVVNAPHIPVHLGAMGETVKCVLQDNRTIHPGDVFVTNDPYRGGSHLPDITVVTPVFDQARRQLLFFTASRAHHAEIGGATPGSMPPFSQTLAEEGVLIRNFKLVDAGTPRTDALHSLLTSGRFPSRNPSENLADIAAQVAANEQGARDLWRLVDRHSWTVVQAYMQHIQAAAEQKMRLALAGLEDRTYTFTDHLDDGSPICVAITVAGDAATFDFSGTGPVLPTNLNANRAIVTAAVMYCLRLLIGEDIPLNHGVLAPVTIILPECLLNPPASESAAACAAVVGGNVETSQRVVDVILGALGIAAASQGTMNNVLFGDETFGFYETICGGAGATSDTDGADAVHTHMTNTRITDPEVLEQRYPVRIHEFSIRAQSGGRGRQRGGNGVTRRIEFLRPLAVSVLTQRRGEYQPFGLHGGDDGSSGSNVILRRDGQEEVLGSSAQTTVDPGDQLRIQTPGGGGYGSTSSTE